MTLGYKTSGGRLVSLNPITTERFVNEGAPALRLSGRETAAMSTGRVMRAAQMHFEFPVGGAGGVVRSGRAAVAGDELGAMLNRKSFEVFEDGDSQLLRLVYREIVLRLKPDVSAAQRKALLARFGLAQRSANAYQRHQFVVNDQRTRRTGSALVELALELADAPEVAFATPNFVSQYRRDATTAPPSFTPATAQWHLRLVRARQAWAHTRGKRNITVAVLDDGVDVEHPELRANVRRSPDPSEPRDRGGRDFFLPDTDADHFNPRPKRFRAPFGEMAGNDIHGTPCAGVAVGRGPRGFGMAPRCRLLPVKIFHADDLAADAQVADALRYAGTFADVLSCSWTGPASADLEAALDDVAAEGSGGRGGRGAVVVCASGNDNRNRVGYPAHDAHCIAVGASTDADELAGYSNRGPEIWVVAPSSGGTRGIFATDVALPGRGFNTGAAALGGADGLYTNDFGGTSSATPLVAGLVALMLSMKPELTVAEVKEHLKRGAVAIGPASSYGANGHSPRSGYGRIDAERTLASVKAGLD